MNKHERLYLKRLKAIMDRGLITKQQFKTFKGQYLNGDVEGMKKGLSKVLNKEKS